MSRSYKFTPERREKIIAATQEGNFKSTAAALVGIDRTTLNAWLKEGKEDHEAGKRTVKAEFYLDMIQAEALGEHMLIKDVKAKKPLEILKRRYRDKWGDSKKVEHSGPDGGPIEHSGGFTVNLNMDMPAESPFKDKEGNPVEE